MKYRALAYNKAEDRFYYVYGLPSYGFDTEEIGEMGTPQPLAGGPATRTK